MNNWQLTIEDYEDEEAEKLADQYEIGNDYDDQDKDNYHEYDNFYSNTGF